MRLAVVTALAALAAAIPAIPAGAAPARGAQAGPDQGPAYALVHGCYALRSQSLGRLVAKSGSDGYAASVAQVAEAEPFRMQATALGRYLLYGEAADFLAAGGGDGVAVADTASEAADWHVEAVGDGAFTLTSVGTERVLAARPDGTLVQVDPRSAREAALFSFEPAAGCATFPESEVNATGEPARGELPYGEVRGLVEGHIHMMAFEFLGGRVHCGRPWHPYGVAHALVDCPDHYAGNGSGAALENVLYGSPARTHDPVGWPTFKDWPHWRSLTHEQTYWKWVERAWRGGLRLYVNLLVDNHVLCELYPYKQNSCNEMDGVRLQAARIRQLEDYVDAQYGGPGKGWFRIVTTPDEARRAINDGKLAVVLGIEVSNLFDCSEYNGRPECDRAQIDRQLEEVWRLGVRDMELVNKFDNALAGVAGDAGTTGPVVNAGNFYETGHFWDMQTCDMHAEHEGAHDHAQPAAPAGTGRDELIANGLDAYLPQGGATPVYPEPPHCNGRGLTELGRYLVERMIERGMIVDPDHLSVAARRDVLTILEAHRYSGVISSHSWSTPDALPRILRLGGVITPMAKSSTGFVEQWKQLKQLRSRRFPFIGIGYGADMNGFASQGPPRADAGERPVRYPFRSIDGEVTLDRQRTGERTWDINVDGVAHYGLYPDWVEDLRVIAGEEIVADLARGAEAYLQMWERATGVPGPGCRSARGALTRRGLARLALGATTGSVLRRAGQPRERVGRAWTWCVHGERNRRRALRAVFAPNGRLAMIATNALGHRAEHVNVGAAEARLDDVGARELLPGVHVRDAGRGRLQVYRVRDGRVTGLAVAMPSVASSAARLRSYLRLAGIR